MIDPDAATTALRYKLHPDTRILPLESIPTELGHEFAEGEQGYVLSVASTRTNAQVIDGVAARFLEMFRSPRSVASAIVELATDERADAAVLVDEIYPAIRSWHRAGVLVDPDLDFGQADMPVLAPGAQVADVVVGDCLRSLTDTQVYRGVSAERGPVVLKFVPAGGGKAATLECLRHEEQMLGELAEAGVPHVPRLLGSDLEADEPYLLLEDVGDTTLEALMRTQTLDWPQRTSVMSRLLGVVADFHESGFLHGDINPANVVVDAAGRLTLVDFGGTVTVSNPTGANRIGVPVYFEPEFAAAFLENETPPPSSVAGEIHALANICYRFITGHSPVRLGLQHQVSIMQIANRDSRPFAEVGVSWPEVEPVLRRALDRDPTARFASVRCLADALTDGFRSEPDEVVVPIGRGPEQPPVNDVHSLILDQLHRRVVDPGAVARQDPACRSHGEIYGGQAGLALAALVFAEAQLDGDALAAADLWLDAARNVPSAARIGRDEGDAASTFSLLQGDLGPIWTRAAVALSSGDWRRAQPSVTEFEEQLTRFMDHGGLGAEPEHTRLDFGNGALSSLVGAAALVYRARPFTPAIDIEPLVQRGDRLYADALILLSARSAVAGIGPYHYLGMAHGTMGALYALLRWQLERDHRDPTLEQLVLDFAADCSHLEGGPAVLPVSAATTDGHRRVLPGWCHGAAGHALFWGMAFEVIGHEDLSERCVAATQHVVDHPASRHGSLCCGLAGQAVALRRLADLHADPVWQERADQFGQRAALSASDLGETGLFKGTAGAVLAMLPSDCRASLF